MPLRAPRRAYIAGSGIYAARAGGHLVLTSRMQHTWQKSRPSQRGDDENRKGYKPAIQAPPFRIDDVDEMLALSVKMRGCYLNGQ